MIQPPEDLNMGHAIAYVLLYAAKYNDGESTSNEFHEILKSMKVDLILSVSPNTF